MSKDPGDELQVIHPLHLFSSLPILVADFTFLLIEGKLFQGQERPNHGLTHALGLFPGFSPDPPVKAPCCSWDSGCGHNTRAPVAAVKIGINRPKTGSKQKQSISELFQSFNFHSSGYSAIKGVANPVAFLVKKFIRDSSRVATHVSMLYSNILFSHVILDQVRVLSSWFRYMIMLPHLEKLAQTEVQLLKQKDSPL